MACHASEKRSKDHPAERAGLPSGLNGISAAT
jgi:hypothetical protein